MPAEHGQFSGHGHGGDVGSSTGADPLAERPERSRGPDGRSRRLGQDMPDVRGARLADASMPSRAPIPVNSAHPVRIACGPLTWAELMAPVTYITLVSKFPLPG